MSLSGGFGGLNPSDLLQMLAWGAKTGLLTCIRNDERRHVFLNQGDVVGVTSSRYKDRLGAVLLRLGFISEQEFDEILNLQASNGRYLGQIFLERNLVSDADLKTALVLQAEDVIHDLLTWSEGEFSFEERPLTEEEHKLKPIVISNLLLEGARRMDEINRVKESICDPDTVFCLSNQTDAHPMKLSRPEKLVFDLLKTPHSLVDILHLANESEYDVYSALFGLLKREIITENHHETLKRKQQKARLDNLLEMSASMEQKGWFHEALKNIEDVLQKNPRNTEAVNARNRLQEKILQNAKSVFKSQEMVPVVRHSVAAVSADRLCLNQREGFVFFRIDGSTNLKNLRYVTRLDENELYIILHKFIRMGLIFLDDKTEKKRKQNR